MAYAERRGRGPAPWRVKYKRLDGTEGSQSGFETKKAALEWGNEREAENRRVLRGEIIPTAQPEAAADGQTAPKIEDITVGEWIDTWQASQDVGVSTEETREYLIRRFIRPRWGSRPFGSLAGDHVSAADEINAWERGLPAAENVSARTAMDARSLLGTILGDAAVAKPPLIPFNPALRLRNRGRKTGRRLAMSPPRTWATPLEALLVAERAALLTGHDGDFVMLITIPYTGLRFGETIGLEREFRLPGLINVEWQLHEAKGRFHRLPPKDDSYRSLNWEPRIPVDLPPFLDTLLTAHAAASPVQRCSCAASHGGSGRYLFTGPDGGHHRRSNFGRRIFRPACDGRYAPVNGTPGQLVIVDGASWPGQPVASWPPAITGVPFEPPAGRGTGRLLNNGATGRCPVCGRSVKRLVGGMLISHKVREDQCPGSGLPPAEDPALAAWLPVKHGLTAHGFRHSHKTWMIEDAIPEILAEIRLGHLVPGMRGLYSHVSDRMRDELKDALQARWESSLKERFALAPYSMVPVLDSLLAPLRETGPGDGRNRASQIPPNGALGAAAYVA
jgi:integrase